MAKKYAVTCLDTTYLPQGARPNSFSVPYPEMFDSREEAEEFIRAAREQDTERRHIFGVNEVETAEQ